MAIGSGGLSGVGLGSGGSKWCYLPERHTDFIFSVYCEETGFLGGLFMLLLIAFIIWRGILVAVKAPDNYSALLAIGLISCIGVQSIVNLFVCAGLFPVTGVTLPFVSYGGTSVILRMESEKRLEATVYEAEWAYLPCFNDLGLSLIHI